MSVPSSFGSLRNGPPAPWLAVYRKIVEQITSYSPLKAVKRWRVYTGAPKDLLEWAGGDLPGIALWPTAAPASYSSPDQLSGWMSVAVQIATDGYYGDDPHTLWWWVVKSLHPDDQATLREYQLARRLPLGEAAGLLARTGLIQFDPFVADMPEPNTLAIANGSLRIEVALNLNP